MVLHKILTFSFLLLGCAAAHAAESYHLIDLGTLGTDTASEARGLNDQNVVVGRSVGLDSRAMQSNFGIQYECPFWIEVDHPFCSNLTTAKLPKSTLRSVSDVGAGFF